MKVEFRKVKKSYYDDNKDEIIIREELLNNKDKLAKVLKHEIIHARHKSKLFNKFMDFDWIPYLILIITFLAYFWEVQSWQSQVKYYFDCCYKWSNFTIPINFSQNISADFSQIESETVTITQDSVSFVRLKLPNLDDTK